MSEYGRRIAVGAAIAVVVGSIFIAGLYYLPQNSTSHTNSSTVETTTQGNMTTGQSIATSSDLTSRTVFSTNSTAISYCTSGASSFYLHSVLSVSSSSPAYLCVKFYYYGEEPANINTTAQLQIKGISNSTTIFQGQGYFAFDGSSNFTISASPANITIGGPSNENEGTMVIYTITAKPGASGTYAMDLGWIAPEIVNCGVEFTLVSGDGSPNYTFEYGCITLSRASTQFANATTTTANPYLPGYVFVEPVGAVDSAT